MAFWFAVMLGKRKQVLRKKTHRAERAERAGWLQGPELAGDVTVAIIATNTDRGGPQARQVRAPTMLPRKAGPLHDSRDRVCLRPSVAPGPGQS